MLCLAVWCGGARDILCHAKTAIGRQYASTGWKTSHVKKGENIAPHVRWVEPLSSNLITAHCRCLSNGQLSAPRGSTSGAVSFRSSSAHGSTDGVRSTHIHTSLGSEVVSLYTRTELLSGVGDDLLCMLHRGPEQRIQKGNSSEHGRYGMNRQRKK